MLVAYQGVPGAYSEMAARALFPDARPLPCETFEDVFAAVLKKKADRGVLPVENSLAGSIHQNYDLLVHHDLVLVAETYVRVQHALMALPGTRLSAVRAVRSHPQALAQCSAFFAENPRVKPVVWYDTAGAARSLREDAPETLVGTAAIASEPAAALYGLKILKRRLQNRALNVTRFLAVARPGARVPPAGSAPLKTSLTFIPARNRAGVLHAVTGVFAAGGIDLTKIESRPDPDNAFDYRFYLDAAGGAREPALRKALAALAPLVRDLRVLGSYPKAKLPSGRASS